MFALEAGQLFDGERAVPSGALVTVEGSRIVGVAPRGAPLPPGCEVTSFPDATLLPGLIDTHVHLCCDSGPAALERLPQLSDVRLVELIESALRAHLASGVTTVRDLGDPHWAVLEWRDRDRANTTWPTVLGSGPPITSPGGHCSNMGGEVQGIDGLRRAVRDRAERGADIVKIMASGGLLTPGSDSVCPQFSVEEIRAVVDEAHALGLRVTAHAHALNAIQNAVMAGVDGVEHCSFVSSTGARHDPAVVAALADAQTWVCPTLGRDYSVTIPPAVQERMRKMGLDYDTAWKILVRAAGDMRRVGVRIVSGTDGGVSANKPHGMLPDAVIDLVDGGVAVTDALATATSTAASACGLADRKGWVRPGFDADLLLVDGDPLVDITALRNVRAVYLRGGRV